MSAGGDDEGAGWAAPGGAVPPPTWSPEQPPPAPGGWAPPPGGPISPGGFAGTAYAAPPAPRPGIVPLRPLGVGEVLDGAFRAIRRYPKATLGLAACVMLAVEVIEFAAQAWLLVGVTPPPDGTTLSDAGDYFARVGTTAIIGVLVSALATLVLTGLLTAVVGEAVLGRPVQVSDAWRRVRPLLPRLAGVSVIVFFVPMLTTLLGALAGIIVLAVSGGSGGGLALFIIGAIAGGLVGIWLYVGMLFAPAAVVLEGQRVGAALRRSRALVRTSWWRVFGITVLAAIIAGVVSNIVALPFGFAGGTFSSLGGSPGELTFTALLFTSIGRLLAGTIARPFTAGISVLLYIDRRMRAEALDMTLVRAAAERPRE